MLQPQTSTYNGIRLERRVLLRVWHGLDAVELSGERFAEPSSLRGLMTSDGDDTADALRDAGLFCDDEVLDFPCPCDMTTRRARCESVSIRH